MVFGGVTLGQRDLDWICEQLRIGEEERIREVMRLHWVENLGYVAIAAQLGISSGEAVRQQVTRFKKRFRTHLENCPDRAWGEQLAEAMERISGDSERPGTVAEDAAVIMADMRGPRRSSPATPTFDERGRQVGARAPVITKDWLMGYIGRMSRIRRERSEDGLWSKHVVPAEFVVYAPDPGTARQALRVILQQALAGLDAETVSVRVAGGSEAGRD
jgi:hypothetical protein